MIDLQELLAATDALNPDDLERLNQHVQQRRHQGWIVRPENIAALEIILRPVHNQTASMTDEEIDVTINDAIAEVRRERKA